MDARWRCAARLTSARKKLLHPLMRDPEQLHGVTPTEAEIGELPDDVDGRLLRLRAGVLGVFPRSKDRARE